MQIMFSNNWLAVTADEMPGKSEKWPSQFPRGLLSSSTSLKPWEMWNFTLKNWKARSIHPLSIKSAFWFKLERCVKCKLVWKVLPALKFKMSTKTLKFVSFKTSCLYTVFERLTLKVHYLTFGHNLNFCSNVSKWQINSASKSRVKLLFNPSSALPLCLFTGK